MTVVRRHRLTGSARDGRTRATFLARRLGTALRDARTAGGLTQAALAERAGTSQTEISWLERGFGVRAGIEVWAACASALGLQLAAFLERAPGADLPRDIEHLRRQALVVRTATPGGWTPMPEAAITGDGPRPRSIDVLLNRRATREAAVVEIWDLLADGGEAMRGLDAKVLAIRGVWAPSGTCRVCSSCAERLATGGLSASWPACFGARFPASSAAWLRALTDSNVPMPDASGLAWTDVRGTRLVPARLRD